TKTVTGTAGAWYEFDVTNYLKQQKAAGATAVGFMLGGTTVSQGYASFNSDEANANRPQLVVNQTPSTGPQELLVSPGELTVPEGSSAPVTVQLQAPPASDMIVQVVKVPQGDPDLGASPSTLTFTATNWNTPQTLTFFAGEDADSENGTAVFELDGFDASGQYTSGVTATERDNDTGDTLLVSVRPAADSYVRDGTYSGQNYGQAGAMELKNVGTADFDRQAYLRFDLNGIGAADDITSAKVRLNGRLLNTAVSGMPVGLYAVASTSWSESGLTWSNKPAAGATALATKTVSGTTGTWYEFDVTSYLRQQRSAGATAVSFALAGTTASQGYASFNSDEAAANGPQLVVTQANVPILPALAGFTLVNAATDQDIGPLVDGQTIDLTTVGSQLTVRANPLHGVESVWFYIDGESIGSDSYPFAVGTDSLPWTPTVGAHTVTATPYSAEAGTGQAGTPITVHFNVIDSTSTPSTVTLADAADAHVRDGSYATQNFGQATTLEVKNSATSGYRRQSFVRFDLTGVGSADDITSAKVRLFGRMLSADAASLPVGIYSVADTTWSENAITSNTAPAAGASPLTTQTVDGTTGAWYEFDVTIYLKAQKAGGATAVAFALKSTITSEGYAGFNSDEAASNKPQLVVTSTTTPGPTPTLAGLTLVNAQTDQDIGPFTDGATIDLAGGAQFSVRADPGDLVGSVSFVVDGVNVRTESSPPLTIAGDNAGDYLPWTPPLGAHTLVVTPFGGAGGAGTAGTALTVHFNVIDSSPPPPSFQAHVNFQPSGAPVPSGYVADTGLAYGARNGLTYGWATAHTDAVDR
ncbi:MAG TPA: DNRLRE domain-containing protein, partial [Gemmataceae bacterium]|nr:DNRLRE domain-containing protein [Gemmataceae bacterium]